MINPLTAEQRAELERQCSFWPDHGCIPVWKVKALLVTIRALEAEVDSHRNIRTEFIARMKAEGAAEWLEEYCTGLTIAGQAVCRIMRSEIERLRKGGV